MGFLDNVKDALKGAVSTQASKDEEARKDEAPKDDVVVDKADTTTAGDSATPAPPAIPSEPTVGPVQPADSVVPTPATPTETVEEDRQEAREKREDAREAKETKFETYTVKSGDSLSEIGAKFGVSYQEIVKLNNIENPDLIFPGQVFRIPKN